MLIGPRRLCSDFLISDLAKIVTLLGEHGFGDQQSRRYLIVDDLDKNWMPNSAMFVGLTKALLHTVRELNRQLPAAKIIVALRDDVFQRVFASSSTLEPQREKWLDVQLSVRWKNKELVEVVDRRLEVVARGNYTKEAPRFADFLPQGRANKRQNPEEYILDRTLQRPRDLLDFLNTCVRISGGLETLTWGIIRRAEAEYSVRRYSALLEEWRGTYDGLDRVIQAARPLGRTWSPKSLEDQKNRRAIERCGNRGATLVEEASRQVSGGCSVRGHSQGPYRCPCDCWFREGQRFANAPTDRYDRSDAEMVSERGRVGPCGSEDVLGCSWLHRRRSTGSRSIPQVEPELTARRTASNQVSYPAGRSDSESGGRSAVLRQAGRDWATRSSGLSERYRPCCRCDGSARLPVVAE